MLTGKLRSRNYTSIEAARSSRLFFPRDFPSSAPQHHSQQMQVGGTEHIDSGEMRRVQ